MEYPLKSENNALGLSHNALGAKSASAALVVGCLVINVLTGSVLGFIIFLIIGHLSIGSMISELIPVVFGGVGAFILWKLVSSRIGAWRIGEPKISTSVPVGRPGEPFVLTYAQVMKSSADLQSMELSLFLRESATYSQGKGSAMVTEDTYHWRGTVPAGKRNQGEQFRQEFTVVLAPDAMHTFVASSNKLQWFVKIEIRSPNWPLYSNLYEFVVMPTETSLPNASDRALLQRPGS